MPKGTEEEKSVRSAAIQFAQKGAVEIPLQVMSIAASGLPIALAMVKEGNPNSVTDAGVGAAALHCGVYGAYLNVLINLKDLKDKELASSFRIQADQILQDSHHLDNEVKELVFKMIST